MSGYQGLRTILFGGLIIGAWFMAGVVALARGKWLKAATLIGSCFVAAYIAQATGLIE
ncbi:hypothetical protein [Lacipirellula parvula]|nr:hypothetical protein [Lacipirellula parvula]